MNPLVGGECEYKNYKGTARIASIRKVTEEKALREEKFEVKFFFLPEEKIEESFAKVKNREFLLEIHGRSHFSLHFLRQNRIQAGATIDCILKLIIRGTCTPVLFEFPSLKP